jgi:hypothetical protein
MYENLCSGQLFTSGIGGGESDIDTPGDVVEFDEHIRDLAFLVDFEQVESLDGSLSGANDHLPVPQNIVAASRHDLDCLDVIDRWSEEDTIDVVLLAREGDATELCLGQIKPWDMGKDVIYLQDGLRAC